MLPGASRSKSDGKIVAAGDAGLRTGNSRFAVARYNSDGTLDTSFGGDGKVMTQFTRHDDPVAGVALQADGKIVVSGGANWGRGGRISRSPATTLTERSTRASAEMGR